MCIGQGSNGWQKEGAFSILSPGWYTLLLNDLILNLYDTNVLHSCFQLNVFFSLSLSHTFSLQFSTNMSHRIGGKLQLAMAPPEVVAFRSTLNSCVRVSLHCLISCFRQIPTELDIETKFLWHENKIDFRCKREHASWETPSWKLSPVRGSIILLHRSNFLAMCLCFFYTRF